MAFTEPLPCAGHSKDGHTFTVLFPMVVTGYHRQPQLMGQRAEVSDSSHGAGRQKVS